MILHIDMFYLYYRQISSTKRLSGHTVSYILKLNDFFVCLFVWLCGID